MRLADKAIFEALADDELMGLCIEREAAGEPYEGRVAVGTVILERVEHRKWDGNTIHEVILLPWQFSWTMPEAGQAYYEEAVHMAANWDDVLANCRALRECFDIAGDLIDGTIPRDPDLAKAHCCQYLNPVLAAPTKAKWLAHGLKMIKRIEHQEFYA